MAFCLADSIVELNLMTTIHPKLTPRLESALSCVLRVTPTSAVATQLSLAELASTMEPFARGPDAGTTEPTHVIARAASVLMRKTRSCTRTWCGQDTSQGRRLNQSPKGTSARTMVMKMEMTRNHVWGKSCWPSGWMLLGRDGS
jgi:hypothetical protein